MDLFLRVADAASRPSLVHESEFDLLGKIDGIWAGAKYIVIARPLAEAIRDLRNAVADALIAEYETGKRDGHNLLMRLADGDLVMNDFEVKTKAA